MKLDNDIKKTLRSLTEQIASLQKELEIVSSDVRQLKNSISINVGDDMVLTRLYNGMYVYVNPRQTDLTKALIFGGTWEARTTSIFTQMVDKDSVVLDIGANYGYYSLIAASIVRAGTGRVFMFEANPHLKPFIEKSLDANSLNRRKVELANVAVSATAGEKVHLSFRPDSWMNSSIHRGGGTRNSVEVPTESIDHFLGERGVQRVDVIKLDVEGNEEAAWNGMRDTISNSPNLKMLFEFTPRMYSDPEGLYKEIEKQFPYRYCVRRGEVFRLTDYASVTQTIKRNMVELVLSKVDISKWIDRMVA